jgi:hypothetical protein
VTYFHRESVPFIVSLLFIYVPPFYKSNVLTLEMENQEFRDKTAPEL